MKTDNKLQELLNKYNNKGEEIRQYILSKNQKRFSRKKIVADLGEYYFYFNCKNIFKGLEQEEKATADFDFKAKSNSNISYQNFPDKAIIRIEVKTRHAQVNDPYLLGVKKNKFDLLVFVHLNEDYSCRYIGIMKKEKMIIKGNQNRLVFNKSAPIVWETAPFEKISGK